MAKTGSDAAKDKDADAHATSRRERKRREKRKREKGRKERGRREKRSKRTRGPGKVERWTRKCLFLGTSP